MKKYIPLCFLLVLAMTTQAQADSSKSKFSRLNWMVNFGYGMGLTDSFDNIKYENYFSHTEGPAMNIGAEVTYNIRHRSTSDMYISSGIAFTTQSTTAMPDAFTHYTFNNNVVQIPLLFTLSGTHGDGRLATIVSVGLSENIQTEGSYFITETPVGTVTKQNLGANYIGLNSRIGIRINIASDLYYVASANFMNPITSNKLVGGYATINMGFGFSL